MRLRQARQVRVVQPETEPRGLSSEILARLQLEILNDGPPTYIADATGTLCYSSRQFAHIETALRRAGKLAPTPALAESLSTRQTSLRDRIHITIDGRSENYNVEHRLLRDSMGQPQAIVGRYLSIDFEVDEDRLRGLAEERLSDLMRLASDWVWETDRTLKLTYVSPRVTEVLGYHPREIIGRRLDGFATLPESLSRPLRQSKARRPFRGLEVEMTHKSGGQRLFRLNGLPVYSQDSGEFQGYRGTAEDVTELQAREVALHRAVDAAEAANRAKSEFLANISHELRTPLNAVIGFSELIKSEIFGPIGIDRYKKYVDDILDSGRHLLALINDILDVTRLEAGNLALNETAVEPKDLVHAALRVVEDRIHEAGHSVEIAIERGLPAVKVDAVKLKQILLNLLTNAIKFTPAEGRLEVHVARAENDGVEFRVRDSGIGIAPEDKDAALTPFRQVDNRLARKFDGTGLGLPIAKALTELHGGTLALESTPGKGTEVTVNLPAERVVGQ